MKLDEMLAKIERRADVVKRSDDFGHDTHALLLWESAEYTYWAEQGAPALLRALRVAIEQRNEWMKMLFEEDPVIEDLQATIVNYAGADDVLIVEALRGET